MSARPAAVRFIFILVVLDVLALGIIIPVLPKLVESFMGGDTARAAEVFGVFGTAWALMQFIFMPIVGALSDRFGRRPVILVSCLGMGVDYIFMALAPTLTLLFVGRVISGITAASITTAFAYISDVTPPDKRAQSFGILGAAFGLGFVLGPALGGVLGGVDPRLPFWVAGTLALANAAYGWFVLPESLAPEKRAPFAWKRANPVASLKLLRSHHELFGLSAMLFLMNLAHMVLPSVAVLYMGYRYGWGEVTVGLVLAGVGICSMAVQGGLIKPMVKRLGERRAIAFGLLFGVVGFAIYGLAPVGWMFLVGVPVMAMWGLAGPTAQSIMTRQVSESEQGMLQGAIASLMSIASLIGPGLFTQTFAIFIGKDAPFHLPGAAFLVAGALLLAATIIGWRATRPRGTDARALVE
ncbi:TCR/Tet family MFS transporter [Usitatibacter palustris]|uniref:Tetracycline resistance protein, class C n=1 Tax=Usitatibacter palustris TaxID=2732487 RepID=A0A6M4H9J3_9PROT|nr:TCR/Tet family MFS transporter [Usitatibacter palustris]QJR15865.1 Tetracycline resistance protein, class C [Usitatibacter palustris]